ncbi:ABC transporter substrate-binding protein [Oceanispirochaeta sp.]|jgi:multiple sugar transport system substrate-binding protein|uniref:ABC transporter substrate-binding protein n=1 Tax=Oceanispirochaeta sp. TaxID=2035350 RepID=UPI0026137C97|nr:ABC transporter substrate-binding protein [Oceanispirochaeta sp.]MDA3957101.1 ABC transporter substrate-binding protein [Oceanispirochaeta sp.]
MKRSKQSFISLLLFIVLVGILAGCSKKQEVSESQTAEPIVLSFWNGFTGPDGEILKEIVDRFNKQENGNIQIVMDIMGWDVLSQKLPPSIATKTAPDMALLIGDWISQYIATGSVQKMDDFWDITGLESSAYLQNVLDLGIYNDSYYSIPMQFNLIYLFWNKQLFNEAGLDSNMAPATMEELADYARRLTDSSKGQFGLGLPIKGAPQYWTSFFWNNGGELFDLEAEKSALYSPQNIKTLSWMQDLAVKDKVTPLGATGGEMENLFMSGKLAMYINGPWMINGIKSNNIDFGVSVAPKGSSRHEVIGGNIGFIIPSSTSEEKKMACYEFMKYWLSDEVLKEWSLKNGFPVWSKAVLKDEAIQADPILGTISPLSSLGRAYNPTAFEGISALDADALWPMMESVLSGDVDPESALKKASEKIDSIFAEY